MTTLNWNELMDKAGGGFEALPVGDYEVTVQAAEAKKTSTDKVMFKVAFTVTSGPHANRKIWNNFVVSPESPPAMSYFFQHMGAMGLTREFFAANPHPDQVAQALVGRSCKLTLEQREWQGQMRNDVKSIKPALGVPAEIGRAHV